MKKRHPIQPVLLDEHNVARFKENKIVTFLLDNGGYDMNTIAAMNFSREDREQFAQLIGYSVSGFCELSYAEDATCNRAIRKMEKLLGAT